MAFQLNKNKKNQRRFEDRPEFQNVIQSLALIRDFGYIDLWSCEADFAQSFTVGSSCAKYIALIEYLETQLTALCTPNELSQFKATLDLLRKSSFMETIADVPNNPLFFRLNSVNAIVSRLLDLYISDLGNPTSKSLNNIYKFNCIRTNQNKDDRPNVPTAAANTNGTRPTTLTTSEHKSLRMKHLRNLRKAIHDHRVAGRSRSPRRMVDEYVAISATLATIQSIGRQLLN